MDNVDLVQLKEMTVALTEATKAMLAAQKHDPSTTASNWVGPHGPQGLFSAPGIRPDMWSTLARPTGLSQIIPLVGSTMQNERYAVLTGQTVTEGTRAADICSEGPMAGKLKICKINIPFGTLKIDTPVQRLNQFGQRIDYADMDKNVINLQNVDGPFIPDVLNSQNINQRTGKLLLETAIAIERSYALIDINGVNGTTSNAADYNLWIDQPDGLARAIRTGYTDTSGVACAALDSYVVTHNAPIGSNGTNGQTLIANVVNAVRTIRQRGTDTGIGTLEIVAVMHPSAFWAFADQWACSYATDRCTGTTGNPVLQSAMDVTNFRDQMLQGNYLLVDGQRIPVVFSHGMQWDGNGANLFNTDVFVGAIRAGGRPLIFRQFFPLNNSDAMAWNNLQISPAKITNGGLYAIGGRTTNGFCSKLEIISQTRLIVDTPWLWARINDITVSYQVSGFDPYVGMSSHRNGGLSTQ